MAFLTASPTKFKKLKPCSMFGNQGAAAVEWGSPPRVRSGVLVGGGPEMGSLARSPELP